MGAPWHTNQLIDYFLFVAVCLFLNMLQQHTNATAMHHQQHAQLCDQQIALSQMLQYLEQQSPAEKKHLVRGVEGVRITSTGRLRW